MKKLLLLALALPFVALMADDDDKAVIVVKRNGEKVAVRASEVTEMAFGLADTIDSRYFLLDKDTIEIHDTLELHDTTIIRDTIELHDTLELHDTTVVYDTLEVHDTTVVYEPQYIQTTASFHRYHLLENPSVEAFTNDFEYPDNDYSFSNIKHYLTETDYSQERPLGVELQWEEPADKLYVAEAANMAGATVFELPEGSVGFVLNNLVPGKRYFWQAKRGSYLVASDRFYTLGNVRMLNVPGVHNIRDIGGMRTSDGRRIAYGRVFRGGALDQINDLDRSILLDTLGILAEMDVIQANDRTTSKALGETVAYASVTGQNINRIPFPSLYGESYAATLRHVLEFLRDDRPVYLHCAGGADRTGAIMLLLEAVAGCSESDIAKDYELTSFSIYGTRMRTNGVSYDGNTYNYYSTIRYLKNLSSTSRFHEGVVLYLQKIGMKKDEIDELRELLLE